MHEVALVFDKQGNPMRWSDGGGASLPDSSDLWAFLWEHREEIGGVAHTHPWDGPTGPSGTDMTTYVAIESGLGKKLIWPIITMTHEFYFRMSVDEDVYFEMFPPFPNSQQWKDNVEELRRRSR